MFASPNTDHAPTGPDDFFRDADADVIVETPHHVKETAAPEDVA